MWPRSAAFSVTITLGVYTHLFDEARHAEEIRERMAASDFAGLLKANTGEAIVLPLRLGAAAAPTRVSSQDTSGG